MIHLHYIEMEVTKQLFTWKIHLDTTTTHVTMWASSPLLWLQQQFYCMEYARNQWQPSALSAIVSWCLMNWALWWRWTWVLPTLTTCRTWPRPMMWKDSTPSNMGWSTPLWLHWVIDMMSIAINSDPYYWLPWCGQCWWNAMPTPVTGVKRFVFNESTNRPTVATIETSENDDKCNIVWMVWTPSVPWGPQMV